MQTAPANWATYIANINHKKEYQVIISEKDGTNPVTYGMESIKAASIESALLADDKWIGNCISRKLSISLINTVTVPRMAKIAINVRLVLNGAYTDYMPLGTWWVDERPSGSLWVALTCYDAMLKTEQPFIDAELESSTWPIAMTDAVTEICTRIGVTLDSRTAILTGSDYVVPYTNDLTMREVLENIGAAHGGNWTITSEGKLRLIVLSDAGATPVHALGQKIKSFYSGDALTVSSVTLNDDADNAFTAGDSTGYALNVDCLYATQAIADALCNTTNGTLYGVAYKPFEAMQTYLDPLAELGDDVSVNGISSVIFTADISITSAYTADISCPYEQEVDHEFPYLTAIERQAKRTVKLNSSYYGTTISRTSGLVIDKLVNDVVTARAIFNSDTLAMQALKNGVLTNCVYFDPAIGKFVFDGELSADVINALSAVITPNLYADKATISELTVDQLDTSVKIQNYLKESTADVNYIKAVGQIIQFITASVATAYGATRTSSGSWDMASNQQTDTYYSIATVNNTTGAISYSGGATMSAWDAYNSGRIYRAIDATSFYKLTGKNALAYVLYDVYTAGAVGTNYEQAKNRNGDLLYWTDETHVAATTDETAYPVYIYLYNEAVKMGLSFYDDTGTYIPRIVMGAGTGTGDNDKLIIYKPQDEAIIKYVRYNGEETTISMSEFVDAKMRRLTSCAINKSAGQVTVTMEGESTPVTLTYSETATSMTFTWPDGHTATVAIS